MTPSDFKKTSKKGLSADRISALSIGPALVPEILSHPFVLSEKKPSLLPENVIPFEQEQPISRFPGSPMKSDLLDKASEIVTDPLVLVNLVSQRVRQLNSGRSPLIATRPSMGVADIALTEIIEGKIKLIHRDAP